MPIVNRFLFYGLQKASSMIYWKNLKTLFFQIKVPAKRGNEVFQAPLKPRRGRFALHAFPISRVPDRRTGTFPQGEALANLQELYSSYLYIK